MNLSVNIPCVIRVCSYEEFIGMQFTLRMLNKDIKIKMVGRDYSSWYVIYLARLPSRVEIELMLENAGFQGQLLKDIFDVI